MITNTAVSGRTVTITFSKALDPSTVTLGNIIVLSSNGSSAAWPPNPSDLSSYYQPQCRPACEDQLQPADLHRHARLQQLASDRDAVGQLCDRRALQHHAGRPGVTDLVGNPLDGYYTGSFPTGAFQGRPYDFIQNLGFEALAAADDHDVHDEPDVATPASPATRTPTITQPLFIGQVYVPFPGSVAGDQVVVEFSGVHNGTTNLVVGGGGRGYSGTYDVLTTTDSTGTFTVTAPALPEGFQYAVAVVVGQPDQPPLPGYASSATDAFRIDKTAPQITGRDRSAGSRPAASAQRRAAQHHLSLQPQQHLADGRRSGQPADGPVRDAVLDRVRRARPDHGLQRQQLLAGQRHDQHRRVAVHHHARASSPRPPRSTPPVTSPPTTAYVNLTFTSGLPGGPVRARRPHAPSSSIRA